MSFYEEFKSRRAFEGQVVRRGGSLHGHCEVDEICATLDILSHDMHSQCPSI